jgi:hypothetical protein
MTERIVSLQPVSVNPPYVIISLPKSVTMVEDKANGLQV